MGIKLNCPACGKDYDVHPSLAGQPFACSDCGASFTVPTPSAPPESSYKEAEAVVEESGVVACPGCGVRHAVEGLASGTQIECSDCGASFSIQVHDAPQSSSSTGSKSNTVPPGAAVSDATSGKKSSTLSVVSLVLGLGGLLTCGLTAIPAIICGHLALGRIKKGHGDGRGMALTGLIAGYILGIGILCVLLALSRILYDVSGWEKNKRQSAILDKELRYTSAQFQYLGDYMQRKFPNHSVLLIASPRITGSSQYADDRLNTIKDALKDAFANRLTIVGTVHLEAPEDQDGMPPMFETMFTAEAFDEIVADNPEATLILSLVGLPMNWKEMEFWQMGDGKRPKLVITNGQVFELYDPIIQGYVNAVVHYNPSSQYNFQDPVPSDVTEAFKKRYLLIDADNIAKIAFEHAGMFASLAEE